MIVWYIVGLEERSPKMMILKHHSICELRTVSELKKH